MLIAPLTQNNFSSAIDLIKKNDLHADDISDKTNLFVMEENNDVIGTVGIELYGDEALLRSLSVDTEKRSLGIGKQLVDFVENYAARQRVSNIYLLTTTAENFFHKKGYAVVSREDVPEIIRTSSEFSKVCPASAIVMKKQLA
jgi:amino-acid N-acetyltransferase